MPAPLDQSSVRAAFATGRSKAIVLQSVNRTGRRNPDPAVTIRAAEKAADATDRAAGLYVPNALERDFLSLGLSPAAVVARLHGTSKGDAATKEWLQRRAGDLTAYIERRRPEQLAEPVAIAAQQPGA